MEENTKRIYGVVEKSVGKGKVEEMVVGTVSELGIFSCFFGLFNCNFVFQKIKINK